MLNELKSLVISKKNEAVLSLVNGNPVDYAGYRYLQGQIHGIDAILLLIKQLESEEIEDNDE